jgi:hypothetical protein
MGSLDHLVGGLTSELDTRLADVDALLAARYPGERAGRQPVHTVYVPADRFHPDLVAAHGVAALAATDEHADRLLALVDDDRDLVDRVRAKLRREPVEDLRIDFEDGYGTRSDEDEDEDGDVRRAAAGFYRDGLASASGRLRTYVDRRDSGVLDEPTTARALADFLLRGIDCGALSQTEVAERSGLDAHRLAGLAHRATETGGSGR